MSITKVKKLKGAFISRLQLTEGVDRHGISRVQLLRVGTFKHPSAPNGSFQITPEILLKMKANFDANARRLDKGEIALDYGHNDTGKAAGWIRNVELEDESKSLWVNIDYTPEAEKAILEKEWRFISADIDFDYEDNESGMKLGPTLLGAGLVNRPHIKSMKAVFSEPDYTGDENNIEKNKPKGFSMTPEEMMKKIGELEAMISQLKAQVSAAETAKGSAEKQLGDVQKSEQSLKEQLKEASLNLVKLTEEKNTVAKEAKFAEFVAAGKVTPAQKDSFMKMELSLAEEFFKNAKVVNLNENGHGKNGQGNGQGEGDKKTASDLVEERANEMIKTNPTMKFGEACSKVLSADKDLAEKYKNESRLQS